jgi:recombination protein RecT
MGKELTVKGKYAGIKQLFIDNEKSIIDLLPPDMDVKRMIGGLMNQIQVNPSLLDCTGKSLLVCGFTAFTLGLETTPALHQVALVPFNRKVKVDGQWKHIKEAQLMIEYRGLISLAIRSGEILTVDTYIVYKNEVDQGLFSVEYGLEPNIYHKPILMGDKGAIVGTYAVARFRDGTKKFHFMTLAEVYKRRDKSKAYQSDVKYKNDDSPWMAWEEEMIKKTAIKGLAKTLSLSPTKTQFNRAVTLDNLADGGKSQIPHLTREAELLDIDIEGKFNDHEPDPNQIATVDQSDFGKATEGEGDPNDKPQPTEPTPANQAPQEEPKDQGPAEEPKGITRRDELEDRFNSLSAADQAHCKTQINRQRLNIHTIPEDILLKLIQAIEYCENTQSTDNGPETKEEPKESPGGIRNRVVNAIQENPDEHENLKKKFAVGITSIPNPNALLEVDNLINSDITDDGLIKEMDEVIREAGMYK